MERLKKSLVVGLMTITAISMSMVTAPFAGAVSDGDLVKIEGDSAVFYIANGKKHVFPHSNIYFSWYEDFNSVEVVSVSELDQYTQGANVTMRPGTQLVTSPTTAVVYAVEPTGKLRSIVSEENAIKLYGTNWAKNVIDIAPSFMANYVIGTPLTEGVYPAGTLIQNEGNPDVYYIDTDGKARKFADEAAFTSNRFQFKNVVKTYSTYAMPSIGDNITSAAGLGDTSQGGAGTGGIIDPNVGSGVTFALSSDTPEAGNIPAGSPNEFLKINLTAANDGDVKVSGITLSSYGLGTASLIDAVTFYDGGVKIGTAKDVTSDRVAVFNFATPIVVSAGTTKTLTVKATIHSSATGGNYALGIASASSIVTSGSAVSGSFPIVGNTKAIVTGVDLGTLAMTNVGTTDTSNDFGEDNVLLASFDLAATNEPIIWESASFRNNGTNNNEIVSNLRVLIDGDEVAQGTMADRYASFNMNNYLIDKGDTVSVEVYGDLGVGSENDTIDLYIKDAADLSFVGEDYGYGIVITSITALDSGGEGIVVTLQTGEFTIDADKAATPAKDVRAGDDDVVLATINMTSNGEDATINHIKDSGADDFIIAGTGLLCAEIENVELKDVNTGVIYDISVASGTATYTCALTMNEEINVQKGVKKVFELRADLLGPNDSNPIEENDTLKVTLTNTAMSVTGDVSDADISGSDITPSTVSGAVSTVKAASLDWTTTSLTSKTVVPGAKDVIIYSASVKAGNSSYVDITSVTIPAAAAGVDTFTDNNISKLSLYLNGVLLDSKSSSIVEGTAGTRGYITFNSLPSATRRILAGQTVALELKADFTSSFTTTGNFELGVGAAADVIAKDMDNNAVTETLKKTAYTASRTVTLSNKGTLKVELLISDTQANKNTYLLAGSMTAKERYLGELELTTKNEAITVEDIVLGQAGTATGDDIKYVKLYDKNGTEVASTLADSDGNAHFDDINLTINADQVVSYFIGVQAKTMNADGDAEGTATFNSTVKFTIASPAQLTTMGLNADEAIKAKGADSGLDIDIAEDANATLIDGEYSSYADATTTVANITGSVLTSIARSMDDATLTAGIAKTIGKYKFVFDNGNNRTSADRELKAAMNTLLLTISTTTGVTISNVQAYLASDSSSKTTAVDPVAGVATIDLTTLNGDLEKVDGVVELVIIADIAGVGDNDVVQTEIDDLTTDFVWNGNDDNTAGYQAANDFQDSRLKDSDVTGATLSN